MRDLERALLRVFGVSGSTRTTPGRDAIASSFEASVVTATPGKTRVVENSTFARVLFIRVPWPAARMIALDSIDICGAV